MVMVGLDKKLFVAVEQLIYNKVIIQILKPTYMSNSNWDASLSKHH